MSSSPIIQKLVAKALRTDLPSFVPGDTVRVHVKIKEGDKERLQAFEGVVISCTPGQRATFPARKMGFGRGVEPISPFNPRVTDKIEFALSAKARRPKLFTLRGRRGKAARLKE